MDKMALEPVSLVGAGVGVSRESAGQSAFVGISKATSFHTVINNQKNPPSTRKL